MCNIMRGISDIVKIKYTYALKELHITAGKEINVHAIRQRINGLVVVSDAMIMLESDFIFE